LTAALAVPLAGQTEAVGADKTDRAKQPGAFGTLKAPAFEGVRSQALEWLKSVGKADSKKSDFEALWKETDRGLLDLVSATLILGDENAAKLLAEARDPDTSAPIKVPDLLTDAKQSAFYRANLALAYAKALSSRRIFEESVAVLKTIKPEQVVDPAAYFFHRAVAEHAMLLKPEANRSITGLIYDVSEAPERYQMVGLLMLYDMQGWRDKDLGTVARKMDNIERRLELARGGPQTQKLQREVVARLDEIIKELENQAKGA
jgi:hypothetical protein